MLLHETRSGAGGNLTLHGVSDNLRPRPLPVEQGPVFLNCIQETPVTKDTFLFYLKGRLGSFGGHPRLRFCRLTRSVWVGGVSSDTLQGVPPMDSALCLEFPKPK